MSKVATAASRASSLSEEAPPAAKGETMLPSSSSVVICNAERGDRAEWAVAVAAFVLTVGANALADDAAASPRMI